MDEKVKKKPGERFKNPHVQNTYRRLRDFFLWMVGYYRDIAFEKIPEGFSYPMPKKEADLNKPWAMWIGHSTYLLSNSGRYFLTDPIWSKRCSPLPFLGPKRKHPPALGLEELPPIDYVLISHDHYDHLDRSTVQKLHAQFPEIVWIVPSGVKKWFENLEIKKVIELAWWESVNIHSLFKITGVPAQHFSGRKTPDLNKTLWQGYIVEDLLNAKTFYFVGDTGYNPYDFKIIGKEFPKIDLSLIPIGSYSPRKFMAPVHVNPSDAVKIHQDVRSNFSLAMHWKTFRLSEEPMDQPPYDLWSALKREDLNPLEFLAVDFGYKVNW